MDSPARRDMVTDMAIGLILENGLAALTVRGVAKKIGSWHASMATWQRASETPSPSNGTWLQDWLPWKISTRPWRSWPVSERR
jgi:hypothetical protein